MQGDRRYYRPYDQPFIPLAFADAAYRYGQVRPTYQPNAAGGAVPIVPDLRQAGDRLGPARSRIVGEVLIGLLDLDPSWVRHAPQSWTPSATPVDLLMGLDHASAP